MIDRYNDTCVNRRHPVDGGGNTGSVRRQLRNGRARSNALGVAVASSRASHSLSRSSRGVLWLRTIDKLTVNCQKMEAVGARGPRQQQQASGATAATPAGEPGRAASEKSKASSGGKAMPRPRQRGPTAGLFSPGAQTAGNCYQRLIIGLGRLTSHASSLCTTYVAAPTVAPLSSLWCEAVGCGCGCSQPAGSSKQRWLAAVAVARPGRQVGRRGPRPHGGQDSARHALTQAEESAAS